MYGENDVTETEILKHSTELKIFSLFTNFTLNSVIHSPLRNDKNPSFLIGNYKGKIRFKDFGTGEYGDCFKFVMLKYNVNYHESLKIVAHKLKIRNYSKYKSLKEEMYSHSTLKQHNKNTEIKVKRRTWNNNDINYWKQYGWTKKLIDEYHIAPLEMFWINDYLIVPKKDNPSYCFYFMNYKYKIYQPFNKEYRFISNSNGIIQGYMQLPETDGILIISKSMKDIGTIRSCDYWAIAPQSENTMIEENIIKDLHKRFFEIIVIYDNDEPGIKASEKITKLYKDKYSIRNIILPCKEKDLSDYCKNHTIEETKDFLDELIL